VEEQAVTAAYFLMLREGLEAALIVGIIAAYLVKIRRPDAMNTVWLGVGAAIALSIVAGATVVLTIRHLPLEVQEIIEGIAALLAVIVLTWMLFWMRRQGHAVKGDLEMGVDVALAGGSTLALATLAFFAVTREGLETVLFVIAIGASRGDTVTLAIAVLSGLLTAIGIGYAIFALGVRIDLRRFFTVTGVILIFVSAGLVAFGIGEFMEAGLLPMTPVVFDVSGVLPETSPLGSLLNGLLGYRSAMTVLEVAGYLLYLVPVLALFLLWPAPKTAVVSAG
jgi:high-affinity iron transporter